MALFQNSVLQKYLKQQDPTSVAKAYKNFTKYFHNPQIQENIRSSKEEEYQGIFLTELFSKILGYTMKPNADFNLVAEYKNEKNSKKADGAILKDEQAIAVIELKGTNTKDLEKIRQQAFDYKANQTGCVYVITSNYEKLRFYINNAVDFEEFDLFTLSASDFDLLYLCLAKDNVLNNVPLHIKEASVQAEEIITTKFYKAYSNFKRELFRDLVKLNMKNDVFRSELNIEDAERANKNIKHNLFKKSQKLIDRFLFIFFAEDRGLLPPNSTIKILEQWNKLKEMDEEVPLYSRYKKYFNYLDQGRKGTDKSAEIFAYNGGLFKPDSILDSLLISDELLYKHTKELQAYDFESQVDVNILGHIFENSLNEIESVNAEIEGADFDKQKSKRKKDGVFYTPKYITKYIVDNTVGKLCVEKKMELGIDEEEYAKGRYNRKKEVVIKLDEALKEYREWLLQITICDPACGSGAFLNQALDFLIKEHKYISELEGKLLTKDTKTKGIQTAFATENIENTILENNIFGVDLNEESVEIARLSLWLRTAQPRRKLNDLSSNIKCGNSLIDSKAVAGDKAFKWEDEFPNIFAKGGFDIVIGNPPYVKRQNLSDENQIFYLENKYKSATYNFDLYLLFIEKGSQLIKKTGLVSYINPSKFTSTKTGEGLRDYLNSSCHIITYIDFKEYQVFQDATTYCCIFILNMNPKSTTQYYELNENAPQEIDSFLKYKIEIKDTASGLGWQFKPSIEIKGEKQVKSYVQTITGIESGADNLYILEKKDSTLNNFQAYIGEIIFPVIKGTNVYRYYFEDSPYFGIVPYNEDKQLLNADFIKNNYPEVWEYLINNREALEGREKGKMNTSNWYGFVYPKNLYKYSNNRLIWTDISIRPQFVIDETRSWHVRTVCSLELNQAGINKGLSLKLLLGIFNSNLFFYFIKNNSNTVRGGYLRYKPQYVKEFPLPDELNDRQVKNIESAVIKVGETTKTYVLRKNNFQKYLQSQFLLEILPKKLQNSHDLEFGEFIKELNKAIKKAGGVQLSKMDEMDWMEVFEIKKAEAQKLKAEIDRTDSEIDAMVYELYGLSVDEINIVEGS
jgi:type I restriction-modification system DNA methylase subunit